GPARDLEAVRSARGIARIAGGRRDGDTPAPGCSRSVRSEDRGGAPAAVSLRTAASGPGGTRPGPDGIGYRPRPALSVRLPRSTALPARGAGESGYGKDNIVPGRGEWRRAAGRDAPRARDCARLRPSPLRARRACPARSALPRRWERAGYTARSLSGRGGS